MSNFKWKKRQNQKQHTLNLIQLNNQVTIVVSTSLLLDNHKHWSHLTVSLASSSVVDHHHGHWQPQQWGGGGGGSSGLQGAPEDVHRQPVLHLQLPPGLDPGPGSHYHLVVCVCHHVWPGRLQDCVRWAKAVAACRCDSGVYLEGIEGVLIWGCSILQKRLPLSLNIVFVGQEGNKELFIFVLLLGNILYLIEKSALFFSLFLGGYFCFSFIFWVIYFSVFFLNNIFLSFFFTLFPLLSLLLNNHNTFNLLKTPGWSMLTHAAALHMPHL